MKYQSHHAWTTEAVIERLSCTVSPVPNLGLVVKGNELGTRKTASNVFSVYRLHRDRQDRLPRRHRIHNRYRRKLGRENDDDDDDYYSVAGAERKSIYLEHLIRGYKTEITFIVAEY